MVCFALDVLESPFESLLGFPIFESNGSWFVRWSEYREGKRTQPSHKLCSVKHYPKKSEVKPLAEAYMMTVRKTMTVEAGASVKDFVKGVFVPKSRERLSRNTVLLYEQAWRRVESHIGHLRMRDVRVCDVQSALDEIHAERGEELGHNSYVTCSAIFSHALRLGSPRPQSRGWHYSTRLWSRQSPRKRRLHIRRGQAIPEAVPGRARRGRYRRQRLPSAPQTGGRGAPTG